MEGAGILLPFVMFLPAKIAVTAREDCRSLTQAAIPVGLKGLMLEGESRVDSGPSSFQLGRETESLTREVMHSEPKRAGVVPHTTRNSPTLNTP